MVHLEGWDLTIQSEVLCMDFLPQDTACITVYTLSQALTRCLELSLGRCQGDDSFSPNSPQTSDTNRKLPNSGPPAEKTTCTSESLLGI